MSPWHGHRNTLLGTIDKYNFSAFLIGGVDKILIAASCADTSCECRNEQPKDFSWFLI